MKLKYILLILLVLILLGAGAAYWYFFMGQAPVEVLPGGTTTPPSQNGFVPYDRSNTTQPVRTPVTTSAATSTSGNIPGQGNQQGTSPTVIPALRMLSGTPVGGFGASTTASTTLVRWVDRGRGNIYQTDGLSPDIITLSNTIFPRVYESWWNANLTSFVAQYMESNGSEAETVTANLLKRSISTSTNADLVTPFELKGNTWISSPVAVALSPKKDRIFYVLKENDRGVGYVSSLDNRSPVKIFDTPLTQLSAEWPEENTIALTTKGSASYNGFVYFVNPKTGAWKKIVGPLPGLGAKVSRDAKYIFLSVTGVEGSILTSIYDVKTGKGSDAIVRTLADKCTWGNFYKNIVYCGAPAQLPTGIYPDDWYLGTIAFTDKIWQINATNGDIKLVANLLQQADRVIDAFNLDSDRNDNYLFFMNKNDLSLWSLDLVAQ